jgi:hypothetical protein
MTDLSGKFTSLEDQLSTQHGEITTALDSILTALGAPPPGPTTTLADILAAMDQLIVVCTGIRTDMATQQTALLASTDLITTTLETLNSNQSLNAQRLLSAIGQIDPCKPCPTPSLGIPPIDATPQTVNEDHCKRMQALLYYLLKFTVKLDVLSSVGINFSTTVLKDAYDEVISEVGLTPAPQPSLSEFASQVGAGLAYVVSSAFAVNSLPSSFQTIDNEVLLPVLYAADNAAAGLAAYKSAVNGSSLPTPIKNMFTTMAYVSIFNYYYDPAQTVDTGGFDGTICNPSTTVCDNNSSSPFLTVNYHGYWTGTALAPYLADVGPEVLLRHLAEYNVTVVSGGTIEMVSFSGSGEAVVVRNAPCIIPRGTLTDQYVYAQSAGPFVINICANPDAAPE